MSLKYNFSVEGTNQIAKEVVTFHFCLRWVHHEYQKTFFNLNIEI